MDAAEYLAFVPLLFYGIAIAELLGQWRRFFDRECFYLPYFLTTIVFTETAIWNVYLYLEVVGKLADVSYLEYWAYLVQPMVFLLTVSALTPEPEDRDTEAYFTQRIPVIYGLMAAFIFSHLVAGLGAAVPVTPTLVIAIGLCLVIVVTQRIWLVYGMAVVWFVNLFVRG